MIGLYRDNILIGYFDTDEDVDRYIEGMKKRGEDVSNLKRMNVKFYI